MGVPARVLGVSVAGCAALVLGGCGSSGASGSASGAASAAAGEPGAAQLVRAMQNSVRSASSVHVSGRLSQDGAPVTVDLGLRRDGDLVGTISENGAAAQIVAVNSKSYVKATGAFLKQVKAPASACTLVCGKWIQLTAQQAGQLTGDLSMKTMMSPMTGSSVPKLTEAGRTTVDGQPAWVLRAADGSTLDVSSASQHYPLAAANGGSPRQVVTYSQWNAVRPPAAPPASQIINLNGS